MKNWKKFTFAAIMLVVAGFAYIKSSRGDMPQDFRDAAGDGDSSLIKWTEKILLIKPAGGKSSVKAPAPVNTERYESADAPVRLVEWAVIPGGTFMMGDEEYQSDARPVHEVHVKTFEMSKTVVTVEQYAECVSKGRCTKPNISSKPATAETFGKYQPQASVDDGKSGCNWTLPGKSRHPIDCVSWDQANQYARFVGARLPTEAEWEYAAAASSNHDHFPWAGDENATCDRVVADALPFYKYDIRNPSDKDKGRRMRYKEQERQTMVRCDTKNPGKSRGTMPPCSKPRGNTAQGLCDMLGNVKQWVQDIYKGSYEGAPADGSAVGGLFAGSRHVIRGADYSACTPYQFAVEAREEELLPTENFGNTPYRGIGIRLARSRR